MSIQGYAGKIVIVDLSNNTTEVFDSTPYAERFIGGRGLAEKLYWDLVPRDTAASDPENCLICATGPVTGFTGLAGCRWIVAGKSPIRSPEAFSYGNMGARFGAMLKSAGYDALVVKGKAERPVTLFLHDGQIEFKDASSLWGLTTFETIDDIKGDLGRNVNVLTIGPAAENGVVFATAFADGGASVSGGIGSIMGYKNLKAVAVIGDQRYQPAYPDRLKRIADYIRLIRKGTFDAPSPWAIPGLTVPEPCYGCGIGCTRQSYRGADGRRYKSFCQASMVYFSPSMSQESMPKDARLLGTRLCDAYGLDTAVLSSLIGWLMECTRQGLINEELTGLPLSAFGNAHFIEELVRKISFREGFGNILADGARKAAEYIGEKAVSASNRFVGSVTGENRDYDPRLILTTALLMATEPRKPVSQLHGISGNILISWTSWAQGLEGAFFSTEDLRKVAVRFWGGEKAMDFSTFEGKALAAKKVQDRSAVQESLVLCDVHWPMQVTAANLDDHVGNPAVESSLYSAVTGRETSEDELYLMGERIINLQRAICLCQGWGGREGDHLMDFYFTEPLQKGDVFFNPEGIMPGHNSEIITRLGCVLDRDSFEQLKSEYYLLRGWDMMTGYPTAEKLRDLDLDELIDPLQGK